MVAFFMRKNKNRQFFLVMLGIWFSINLVQAIFTELNHDEAYYWMYSNYLSWGYFDHPPMIGFIIRLFHFLPGSLGVRFGTILLSTGTLFFTAKIVSRDLEIRPVFYLVYASVILFHLSGFIAYPDNPLLFFTALWFYFLKRFIEKENIWDAVYLGLTAAALLYSKYHGILVLGCSVLGYIKLFKRKTFYLAIAVGAISYLPHIIWLYHTDFETIVFQLFGRTGASWKFSMVLEYIGGFLAVSGPLVAIPLWISASLYVSKSHMDRVLKFNLFGTILFFLLMSFKGRIEANWVITAMIPLVVLGYNLFLLKPRWHKVVMVAAYLSLTIFFIARIYLISPKVIPGLFSWTQFHNWDNWAMSVDSLAEERNVIFLNSYQKASKYTFYTGKRAHSYNWYYYKKTQYHYWPIYKKMQGEPAIIFTNYNDNFDVLRIDGREEPYIKVDEYYSFEGISVKLAKPSPSFSNDDSIQFTPIIKENFPQDIPVKIAFLISKNGNTIQRWDRFYRKNKTYSFKNELREGVYELKISLFVDPLPPGINSRKYQFNVIP